MNSTVKSESDVRHPQPRRHCPIPRSTFTTYMDEGFMHYRAGRYRKALYCYDCALDLNSNHKGALVARSQCYLKLGDAESALRDSQNSYDPNTPFILGLYQFGEALFSLGSFEKALIAFHNGLRLRRDMEDFRIGVQKCVEAIMKAIADKASTQIEDFFDIIELVKELELLKTAKMDHCCIRPDPAQELLNSRFGRLTTPSKARSGWVAREVLGQMFPDKDYLTKFMHRPDIQSEHGSAQALRRNATEALGFLKIREEFWRAQNPMYSRKYGLNFNNNMVIQYEEEEKVRREQCRRIKMDAAQGAVIKNLSLIQHALAIGRPIDCKLECERTLRQLKKVTKIILPRKSEFVCQIYHMKGLALIQLKNYDAAVTAFQLEYDLAIAEKLTAARSRALDYLGKCYAYKKCYAEASEIWESRLPLLKTPLERAYVYHEIGRCYFNLGRTDMARYFANQSLDEAQKSNDTVWSANARIMLGQIDIKLMHLESAAMNFELAEAYFRSNPDQAVLTLLSEANQHLKVWIEKTHRMDESLHDDTELDDLGLHSQTSVTSQHRS